MKIMKAFKPYGILAAAAILAMSLAACPSLYSGEGKVTITASVGSADQSRTAATRTILPVIEPVSYRASFNGPEPVDPIPLGSGGTGTIDLSFGTWTLTVEALDADDVVIASGTDTFTLSVAHPSHTSSVSVQALETGTGTVDLTITWPANLNPNVGSGKIMLSGVDVPSETVTVDLTSRSLRYVQNLVAGSYELVAELFRDGTIVYNRYDEALQIGGNALSRKTVNLTIEKFDDDPIPGGNGIINIGVVTSTSIELGWEAASDNQYPAEELKYQVYRVNADDSITALGTETQNMLTYTVEGLAAGTEYTFFVRVTDGANKSSNYSNRPVRTETDPVVPQGKTIDHKHARLAVLRSIPESAVTTAKTGLHIYYAHTSHGSQITDGMSGLTGFSYGSWTGALFSWSHGITAGNLDLDYNVTDLGNSSWDSITSTYLNSNPDVNVVMWSWCGQVSSSTAESIATYLSKMTALEASYPNVTFIYMTGHLDGSGVTGNLNVRNQQIRDYCSTNDKWLFDFADIESYDPDDVYYLDKAATDGCDYDSDGNGSVDKNWAIDWQDANTGAWYSCGSAHSQPLNANMKAYAAWYLFTRIAGWSGN